MNRNHVTHGRDFSRIMSNDLSVKNELFFYDILKDLVSLIKGNARSAAKVDTFRV